MIQNEGRMTSEVAMMYVGVDVSKARLDVAVEPSAEVWMVGNDEAGPAFLVGRVAGRGNRGHLG